MQLFILVLCLFEFLQDEKMPWCLPVRWMSVLSIEEVKYCNLMGTKKDNWLTKMLLSRGLLAASAGICMVKSVAQLRKNLGEWTCDDDGERSYAARRLYNAVTSRCAVVRHYAAATLWATAEAIATAAVVRRAATATHWKGAPFTRQTRHI